MKKILFLLALPFCASAQDYEYYLPAGVEYHPDVPRPHEIIYHMVGEWHVTHDRLLDYMDAVAETRPDRVKMETMGFSYERRPQVLLIITSPKNHQRLEEIRQQHLRLSDPYTSANVDTENMPAVVWIGHSIHGNEASGANAALLSAYYLAAAEGAAVERLLDNLIILFDPSFNPDGLQRFSTWVNQHKGLTEVTDPQSREFNEVWPGGRFNHYWFDLNRDWLPAVHPVSQNRLHWFHRWKPNVLTDHHEMGSNSSFFFQPGVPSRVNPLTPEMNQELTAAIGKFHAKYLDSIGSLYFTKEAYDDFYYGKGSTYPDINGAVGILFEQASSRGHAQETQNGILRFPFTIRNQFVTALSTLEAASTLRRELLNYQRDFYQNALKESRGADTRAYVFGGSTGVQDNEFLKMLLRHGIEVRKLGSEINRNGRTFSRDHYIVPTEQPQYRLIRTIFETGDKYRDSLFYDITTWTMPLAMGVPYAGINGSAYRSSLLGSIVSNPEIEAASSVVSKSGYAYLLPWSEFFSPSALHFLQREGLKLKVATRQFELMTGAGAKVFEEGTILIPVAMQEKDANVLHDLMQKVSETYRVKVVALNSGAAVSGVDLGSSRFMNLVKPNIALLAGQGVNATDAGEIWHMLDRRFRIPVSLLEPSAFNSGNINRYNTLIMPSGNYGALNKEKLREWVSNGGVLIVMEEAIEWVARNGISSIDFKRARSDSSSSERSYADREEVTGAQRMSGAIFKARMDLTHPLAFGYNDSILSTFKANRVYMKPGRNPYATPFLYDDDPLQSGWISRENKEAIKNTAAVLVQTLGRGRVIHIAENPNFRGFWLGGSKLFLNAVFFGQIINAASARAED